MLDSPAMIKLENTHKYFGENESRLHVLKGIDLEIQKGEMAAIMGSSGSGKSTLLNIIGILSRQAVSSRERKSKSNPRSQVSSTSYLLKLVTWLKKVI